MWPRAVRASTGFLKSGACQRESVSFHNDGLATANVSEHGSKFKLISIKHKNPGRQKMFVLQVSQKFLIRTYFAS